MMNMSTSSTRQAACAFEMLEGRRLLSASGGSHISGELLVSFEPGVNRGEIASFYREYGFSEREALDKLARNGDRRLKLVSVPAAKTLSLIPTLQRDPRVAYAEPNYFASDALTAATPTDPLFVAQHQLNNVGQWSSTPDADIDAPEAWTITTGSPDVLVAVFDTGVDYNHPDLAANIWANPFEVAGDGIDNDANGYVDDVHGINALNDSGDPREVGLDNHGTFVSGVLGATPYNEGVVGVAHRVGIIAIKMVTDHDTVRVSDVVQGLQYVNYLKNVQGQNIVATNHSYGIHKYSRAWQDAMAGADQPGMSPILHVCSAGNDNHNSDADPQFPAGFELDNVIAVTAVDVNDDYSDIGNWGPTTVDLAAPSGHGLLLTTAPNNRYDFQFGGTSGAAPQVAGAAALVSSAFPSLTAAQIKQRILAGVDPIGHIGNNFQKHTLTNGRLNVANALIGAAAANDHRNPAAVGDLTVAATDFQSATLTWTATGDDGATGLAGFYDIRYATAPITSSTWDSAARALAEPGPRGAGSGESFVVSGLDPDTTYHFALRVRDDMGNQSAVSNGASGITVPATSLFSDSVESGGGGWTASGLWHRSTLRANSPSTAWYYGVESTRTYDTSAANAGRLTSTAIQLPHDLDTVLIYREWREVEDVPFADSARVEIGTGPNRWETASQSEFTTAVVPLNWQGRASAVGWSLPVEPEFSTPQWVSRAVDLSAYAGKTIRIRFAFDTIDAFFNDFEGWYVDDVNVFADAGAASATAGAAQRPPLSLLGDTRTAAVRTPTAGANPVSLFNTLAIQSSSLLESLWGEAAKDRHSADDLLYG